MMRDKTRLVEYARSFSTSCDGLQDKMMLQGQAESVLTIKVTSLMAKRALNVKKNWLKAAHFQCRLS